MAELLMAPAWSAGSFKKQESNRHVLSFAHAEAQRRQVRPPARAGGPRSKPFPGHRSVRFVCVELQANS